MLSRFPLIRYNFRVLMFQNWWLLVIPLAASQLGVFWLIITQGFALSLPATFVELVSPLIAAYLCAHLLAAEYRSDIGAILASKPVDIGKVVWWRLVIVLGLVWTLGLLSLFAIYFGMEAYPVLPPFLAMIGSTLFLALFALTFATLFRSPMTGFGIAALYWGMDLPSGPPINPFLSLKALAYTTPEIGVVLEQPMTDAWWASKIILVVAAIGLYFLHQKLLFGLGSSLTLRRRRRAFAWVAGVLAFYMVSGAVIKVVYGYQHRASLQPDDVVWFRKQFAPFGPLPIVSLFGSNFKRYVGDIPNSWRLQQDGETDKRGDTEKHRRDLEAVVNNAPNSIWAPSAAALLADLKSRGAMPADERAAKYRLLLDRYPDSPYILSAMQQIAHTYSEAALTEPQFASKAKEGYEALLKRFPNSKYTSEAMRFFAENARRGGDNVAAEKYAQEWVNAAPVYDKFEAWYLLAGILNDLGKRAESKEALEQTFAATRAFRQAVREEKIPLPKPTLVREEKQASATEMRAQDMKNKFAKDEKNP